MKSIIRVMGKSRGKRDEKARGRRARTLRSEKSLRNTAPPLPACGRQAKSDPQGIQNLNMRHPRTGGEGFRTKDKIPTRKKPRMGHPRKVRPARDSELKYAPPGTGGEGFRTKDKIPTRKKPRMGHPRRAVAKHCVGVLCLDNAFALIERHPQFVSAVSLLPTPPEREMLR